MHCAEEVEVRAGGVKRRGEQGVRRGGGGGRWEEAGGAGGGGGRWRGAGREGAGGEGGGCAGRSRAGRERGPPLEVPRRGGNRVQQVNAHPRWAGIDADGRCYVGRSDGATGGPEEQVAGRCEDGRAFAAAGAKRNVCAVQFHPEKSADAGLKLLENFLRWRP